MNNNKIGSIRSWLKSIMLRYIPGMITCKEFDDFVQAYIDDELPARQRSVFEQHIRFCRECRNYLAAYKRTIEISRSVLTTPKDPIPGDVPEDLINAILEARKQ